MSRARVCFVVESGTDVRLVEGLAERYDLSLVARTIRGGVAVSHPPAPPVPIAVGPSGRLGFARYVRRALRAAPPDVILVQGYGLAALAANRAGSRLGIPIVMLVCSPIEEYYRCRAANPVAGKPYRATVATAIKLVAALNARLGDGYVVLSQHLHDVVQRHGTRRPIHIIPIYGVDTDRFTPSDRPRAELKRRLGLPAAGAVIFFSSRIAPEKDVTTLLHAVARLVTEGRDVTLLHRSGGYREFARAAAEVGLADRVIATDARHPHDGLREDYCASDVCVQASRAEGLGFSPLEALACGTPVVATAVGGLRETIIPGETGWTYPVGDVARLAATIAEVLDTPQEGARRAMRGRELVRARFERTGAFDALERALRLA